jgi:hypothetical protein
MKHAQRNITPEAAWYLKRHSEPPETMQLKMLPTSDVEAAYKALKLEIIPEMSIGQP